MEVNLHRYVYRNQHNFSFTTFALENFCVTNATYLLHIFLTSKQFSSEKFLSSTFVQNITVNIMANYSNT